MMMFSLFGAAKPEMAWSSPSTRNLLG